MACILAYKERAKLAYSFTNQMLLLFSRCYFVCLFFILICVVIVFFFLKSSFISLPRNKSFVICLIATKLHSFTHFSSTKLLKWIEFCDRCQLRWMVSLVVVCYFWIFPTLSIPWDQLNHNLMEILCGIEEWCS